MVCYSSHDLKSGLRVQYSDHSLNNRPFNNQTYFYNLNTRIQIPTVHHFLHVWIKIKPIWYKMLFGGHNKIKHQKLSAMTCKYFVHQTRQLGHVLQLVVREGAEGGIGPLGTQDRRDWQIPNRDVLCRRKLLLDQVNSSLIFVNLGNSIFYFVEKDFHWNRIGSTMAFGSRGS